MKEIINNIEVTNSKGKKYYCCWGYLEKFIPMILNSVSRIKEEFRGSLAYHIIGYEDGIVIQKKEKQDTLVVTQGVASHTYLKEIKLQLEEGQEIKINNWKFKIS